ncbi:dual specificity tyrosine-phosphorylation-regulated kinase 3-like [Petromyzon marinus]|uniref:dual specificity tyrosine-phosphorylation-regulated kinase 3-like n=1 Tax=Petromyzon marinus TaxID=7757 RepID=UPI003F6F9030
MAVGHLPNVKWRLRTFPTHDGGLPSSLPKRAFVRLSYSNVLLANIVDGIVRVRNFASSFFVDGKTSHVGGTLAYVAPEVLLGYPATCAVDTWSLGCTVAKLATDRELFLSFSRDDHLACCIEILGMPPKEMVEKARKRAAYFGELKGGVMVVWLWYGGGVVVVKYW